MRNIRIFRAFIFLFIGFFSNSSILAQSTDLKLLKEAAQSLKFRSIGPAVMGGRIADISVNPQDKSNWYVAVGSGGLWKTNNSGITWTPVFDKQSSYSIGTVSIDPKNPNVVWVGTGENVSGRHVGWGDGVYRSLDAGKTWQNMGLKKSEHIGKILINPTNSDVVFVAAEGPLWSSGGERGLYKTTDGGGTWKKVIQIDDNTGVTDVEFHPSNPEVLYAATYQRRRHTWSLLAGGPQSGIYKSIDSGETWKKVSNGLPDGDMGKIGLAVTKANPQIVYATIEADDKNKGFYRSMDKGESWEKRSSYISGGTGPHYYQEIEASQVNPELIYQMDVFLHVSRDGGKSFDYLGTGREKHSDNHALWIEPENGQHLIAGSDGGLYESFDEGTTWRHFPNLPISQLYKISLDNAEPFYNVVAGAQDLGTLIGPSRTMHTEGVRNQDWYIPLGADGYDCAFDPEDPNTVYMEIQEGLLFRLDRKTEEVINIQPQPESNDPPERFNWDSPLLISPHDNKSIYFGSQRLWKSEDRGNSWEAKSKDLTTNRNRYELEMIDRVPSVDALYDNYAMSKYATLTSISESPLAKGLLYTGSDDGLIQVSEDDGLNWRRCQNLPKVPEFSFINDVEVSSHDVNTVFAVADAHKSGNYSPFVFISKDRGKSWESISGDLPSGTIVWVIKQDHKDENLLFIGTEYGIYFSPNKGSNWIKMEGGLPTISFRDIELHKRDNDLVAASFGRGIYVLDDYSSLRELNNNSNTSKLFSVRDAWWYIPSVPMQAKGMPSSGSTSFRTENPPFGALITYYLKDFPKTSKESRTESEKKLKDQNASIPFPGWDRLNEESKEDEPQVLVLVRDENGNAVRWIKGEAKKGVNRVNWDLRLPASDPINLVKPVFNPPWAGSPQGPMVAPGKYSAELFITNNGNLLSQSKPQDFLVKPTPNLDMDTNFKEVAEFTNRTNNLSRRAEGAGLKLGEANEKLLHIQAALLQTSNANPEYFKKLQDLKSALAGLNKKLYGDPIRQRVNENTSPSIMSNIWNVIYGHWNTTQLPTATQKSSLEQSENDFLQFLTESEIYFKQLSVYEEALEKDGAPWTPGRKID
jgi:photosystem II stability/assembly factor-like uncharacterized protein